MNSWSAFLAYAKLDNNIPKSMKARSALYQQYKKSCACGEKNKLCNVLNIQPMCKTKYDYKNDPAMLHAKIKAYEEIISNLTKSARRGSA